jgi:hypothetical protein
MLLPKRDRGAPIFAEVLPRPDGQNYSCRRDDRARDRPELCVWQETYMQPCSRQVLLKQQEIGNPNRDQMLQSFACRFSFLFRLAPEGRDKPIEQEDKPAAHRNRKPRLHGPSL